jgi:hypothetical protein
MIEREPSEYPSLRPAIWTIILLWLLYALAFGACQNAFAQVVTTREFPQGAQVNNQTASANFTTGTAAATLTAQANKWTYICGFTITTGGTSSATTGNVTITGTIGGTMNFTYVFVSSGQGIMGIAFPGCISSSAVNTAIAVNVPAGGAGTVGSVTAWGYKN